MNDEQIAGVVHEVNRAYCLSQGDTSQVPWKEAPQWQRNSAMHRVAFIRANPDVGPYYIHNEWLQEKLDNGWKYGPKKNAELKQHPCCVPYDALPAEQRAKDYIFQAVVRELLRYSNAD